MWIYIIIGIVVLLIVYIIALYNSFVQLNNKVDEAFSTMDVYLKKRWDLIPNIVETVKGYAKHEKDTLKEVVELRNSTYDKMSDEDKAIYAVNALSQIIKNAVDSQISEDDTEVHQTSSASDKSITTMAIDISKMSKQIEKLYNDLFISKKSIHTVIDSSERY